MAKTREYETMVILSPELEKEDRASIIERVENNITKNDGEIIETDEWGTRELAYEINDYKAGYYTVIEFKGNNEVIDDLEYDYRILDDVLRFLIVRIDD
ncbi:MAG: 30S ribosomal protein S6 [Halanaerobiaceae bacterium]